MNAKKTKYSLRTDKRQKPFTYRVREQQIFHNPITNEIEKKSKIVFSVKGNKNVAMDYLFDLKKKADSEKTRIIPNKKTTLNQLIKMYIDNKSETHGWTVGHERSNRTYSRYLKNYLKENTSEKRFFLLKFVNQLGFRNHSA